MYLLRHLGLLLCFFGFWFFYFCVCSGFCFVWVAMDCWGGSGFYNIINKKKQMAKTEKPKKNSQRFFYFLFLCVLVLGLGRARFLREPNGTTCKFPEKSRRATSNIQSTFPTPRDISEFQSRTVSEKAAR